MPDEVKAKYIANIKKSGNYLLDLINEVLEMARIENGKISMVIDSIPSADKDRITVQTVIEDNGIGMGIVKKYIDLMGGTVLVESEQGKGTKVTLTISHKLAERPVEKEECQEEEMNFAGTNILLVDDVMINLEIAKEILLEAGGTVDTAQDGEECVRKIKEYSAGTYALILMDVQMPKMDGYQATREIRKLSDKEKAGIPIIAMTANAFDTDKKSALESGMNGFAEKPINIKGLLKEITRVLKEKREQLFYDK